MNFKALTVAAVSASLVLANVAIDSNFATQVLAGQSAQAGILEDIFNRIPTPSGIYANINGHKYYFGDYSSEGDAAVVFKDGTWEVKANGRVIAHGYGRTPDWVLRAITTIFGPIPVY
jgi:hypothetical protein